MPELPEVETIRRGIAPQVLGCTVTSVIVREHRLRWPVSRDLAGILSGRNIVDVGRRGKYLLLAFDSGTLIVHLGMSGSLRLVPEEIQPQRHDHIDVVFGNGTRLRYRDPRRFGAMLWTRDDPLDHPLLASLGPEPLGDDFRGDWLYRQAHGRRVAIKSFLMNSRIVVGVGNIYANESLFMAGIHPARPARRISQGRYEVLADRIKKVLSEAISQGGTTLRDFVNSDGNPGYFSLQLRVYGKSGEPCGICGQLLIRSTIGQRATFFCSRCQT